MFAYVPTDTTRVNKPKHIDFYFDYLSPYAYFAWQSIGDFCQKQGLELRVHPVVFGKLLDHWGQLGPAEIEPKRDWVFKSCYRYAHLNGIAFNMPKAHPFNPLAALRLSLAEVGGAQQNKIITAIFDAGWGRGEDLGDLPTLIAALNRCGLDGNALAERTREPAIKACLAAETAAAIERGVFGIPTCIVGDELFWGNDQLEHMALFVNGDDPLRECELQTLRARPRGIDRKRRAS